MSTAIQNRLVGTIILVALAVIFLPDFLDGKKVSNKEVFVDLPARPPLKPVVEAQNLNTDELKSQVKPEIEIVEATPVDDPAIGNDELAQESSNQSDSAEAASGEPSGESSASDLAQQTVVEAPAEQEQSPGWVVQLGVFKHKKNVAELVRKLEGAGYRAFTRPVTTSAGELTKVFVGPDVQRDKLETALPHLKEVTNLSGKVTPFTVK